LFFIAEYLLVHNFAASVQALWFAPGEAYVFERREKGHGIPTSSHPIHALKIRKFTKRQETGRGAQPLIMRHICEAKVGRKSGCAQSYCFRFHGSSEIVEKVYCLTDNV
jgi:hypothetical protein